MKNFIFYFYFLKSLSFSLNQNVPYACRNGYYYDRNVRKCVECRKECYKCDSYSFGCKTCSSGHYIVDHVCKKCINNCELCENNNSCKRCIKGYFLNSSNKCEKCILSNCQECVNESKCKTCKGNGITLDNISGQCVKCEENCFICQNLTMCKICNNNYGLDIISHKCVECGKGCNKCEGNKCIGCSYYFEKPFEKGCFRCNINNCISCDSDNKCDKCKDNFMLQKNECVYQTNSVGFLVGVIVPPIIIFIIILIIIYCICIKKKRNHPINEPLDNGTDEIIKNNDDIPDSINDGNKENIFEEDYNYKSSDGGYDNNIGN